MIKAIRYYLLVSILTIWGEKMLLSQPCITGNFQFNTQAQIDSFPILYPGCTEIAGSVDIRSDEGSITNLRGLSTLTSIKGNFRILNNLLLESLSGLNNLQSLAGRFYIENNNLLTDLSSLSQLKDIQYSLSIVNNPNLESLHGLDNIKFELLDNLEIIGNTKLEYCHISSICGFVSRYGYSRIYNNGPGCDYIEDIYFICNSGPDSLAPYKELCFEEGFEDWNISNDSFWPKKWKIEYPGLWLTNGTPNVERVPRLNEGNYAILLRSNGPGFEGPTSTIVERQLCSLSTSIDIVFAYTCKGKGSCELLLGQGVDLTGSVNLRTIWRGNVWDTIKQTVKLNNIPVNAPFLGFQKIQFRANPIYWEGGTYGISEFVIDSVVIREYNNVTSTVNEKVNSKPIVVYPSPSTGLFHIYPNMRDASVNIIVSSIDGQVFFNQKYSDHIDLSLFPVGMYFISVYNDNTWKTVRVVKQ